MNCFSLTQWLSFPSARGFIQRLSFGLIYLVGIISVHADTASVTKAVWKMKFGVSEAQVADVTWLAADTDKDGVINSDEISAGTNPFDPGSVVKITDITATDTHVSMTFPVEKGKQYVVQGSSNLTGFSSLNPPVTLVVTSNSPSQTLTAPKGSNKFFRILVQDTDSDGDGVSDWAERAVGYNPNSANSVPGVQDGTGLPAALDAENKVSIIASDSVALQPDAGTAPVDVGQVIITRSGSLHFAAITVPLVKSGTAQETVDYAALPTSVTIPKNASSIVLDVMPTANTSLKTNRVATISVQAGVGYTLSGPSSASVAINPAGVANGTGLTAQYHNAASTTYATQQTIFAGAPELTQVDATIDMANSIVGVALGNPCTVTTSRPHQINVGSTASVRISGVVGGTFSSTINTTLTATSTGPSTFTLPINCTVVPTSVVGTLVGGTNGWDLTTGPVGMSTAATGGLWSARWTGQILPQYSETYTIDFRSDDSAKVWVNGVLLIDRWASQGATDYLNTINLQAGTLYDIQIEYFNNGGNSEARLYWWSPSQVKQIIPQGRLFPAPALASKFTAITSSSTAVGYVSVPFSFALTSPNIGGATTYALAPTSAALPPGLTLNSSTGLISGTPTTPGFYNVAVNATNSAAAAITGSSIIDFTIFPTGSVSREILAGSSITKEADIATLDDDTDYPNNTSRRLRGYIVPPKTGNYYFWLAANNTAEFWLSNNAESVNAIRRASVTASTGKKDWTATPTQPSQMSQWLALEAGQRYYFEVLHNTGVDADDYISLGWCQDDVGTVVSVAGAPNGAAILPTIPDGGAARQGYPYSGTVPSYLCQPYDYPTVASATGTLYAANLGPQGSSTTRASGSANLRVDPSGNSAVLHFNYSGLSSPRTAYHLHVDAFASHPAGEIVYDIDDVDSFHPELRTPDGGYIWNFATGGTFNSIQEIRDAITLGKVYLNVHSVSFGAGEIRGTLTLVDGSQTPPDPALYAEPVATDVATNDANAARFLNQASFGASPTDVAYVKANGFQAWINDQLTKTPSRSSNEVVAGLTADINTPYPSTLFTNAWWKQSITGQDQLRQRLAFALSEIMVVSWANNTGPLQNNGRILADYYDQLVDYCLPTSGLTDSGNFRGILKQVTLTPAMGLYLDMRGNQKGDDSIGRHPNENYAREIMQLFSIGLNRMWDDGKFIIDSNANLVPTYSQPSIIGMATLLTGWNYAQPLQASGRLPTNFSPAADNLNPMVLVPTAHELRYPKLLLNRVVTPAATGLTPRVSVSSIGTGGTVATVTTSTAHGLTAGDTIMIAGVTSGTFTGGLTAINASHQVVAVTSATSFTVAVPCSVAAGAAGTVTGATVTPPSYTTSGLAAITGSQADNTGTTLPHPYDQYGLKELDTAIDNIVNNDNVPPYICRLLIQRLVTSDPSPGYVYRVVQKFKNNGSGVRGDLASVVKQILLDGEARSAGLPNATATERNAFGKQREPVIRLTAAARAFPSASYTGTYSQLTGVNAHKLRIVTSAPNDFNSGFSVGLNFSGNYTTTTPPSPYTNPTSTAYSIGSTLGIASTYLDISSISTGAAPTTITCSQPHGMTGTGVVWLFGLSGKFSDASINSGGKTATVTGPNTFTVNTSVTHLFQVQSVAVGNPCIVTTTAAHGLPIGSTTTAVTINGVNGGAFSSTINATNLSVVGIDATTFSVTGIACTSPPTSYNTWRQCSNPVRVTTTGPHGLANGDSITIAGVSGGSFSPTINGTYSVSGIDSSSPTTFTLTGVSCISPSTVNTGNIVGGNTLDVNATGMVNVTYSQPAGSNVMTVNTGGPATDIAIPVPSTGTTTLKSKVYLDILTRNSTASIASIAVGNPCTITTSAAHGLTSGDVVTIASVSGGTFSPSISGTYAVTVLSGTQFTVLSNCTVAPTAATGTITGNYGATAADGVYAVQTANGSTSFTVTTADAPTAARSGNVIVPKFTTSYTPLSSNTIVQFNTNVNHNMLVGQNVWVDVPVVGTPLADAEYSITETADEDHFKTSYLPTTSSLGTYSKPSGANNGVTIYPLVAPPMGRSGSVVINQSTFNLGSTDSSLSQSPMNSPTVFNFFFPDYKFPGTLSNTGVDSPEFQLSTDTNLSNLTNSMTNMFIGTGGANGNLNGLSSFNNGSGNVVMDIGNYMTLAKTQDSGISALIDELAALLVGGTLDPATKTTIQNFVTYRRAITNISLASPCVVTTAAAHGLVSGNQIAITDVTGGTFSGGSTSVNGTFVVTVTGSNTFRISSVAATPVAVNCTSNSAIVYTNANISNFPMSVPNPGPTNLQKRDRVRAILHLILTSAEFAIQK